MTSARTILVAGLVLATGLAGCFGGDAPPSAYSVSASGGHVADGWDHSGENLVQGAASMEGAVNVDEDTGIVNITFEAWNSSWTITHDTFTESAGFQDGGIARDVVEHGDSGQGHTDIPRVEGEVMTWGSAEVLRDGEPYAVTGSGAWSAHIMFNENTVRGSDGAILNADGSAPFDPGSPADARIAEDDPQALLEMKAPDGADAAREPVVVNDTIMVSGPGAGGEVEVPTEAFSTASIDVATSGGDSPLQGGTIEVRIEDSNGTALQEDSAQFGPDEGYANTFEVTDVSGPVTVAVSGNGTYEAQVDALVTYDDHSHITVTWDDYTLDPR